MKDIITIEKEKLLELIPKSLYFIIGPNYFKQFDNYEVGSALKKMTHLKEVKNKANERDIDMNDYSVFSHATNKQKNKEKFFYELLDYQFYIKNIALNNIQNNKNKFIIHMPTGTGKTKTTSHILAEYFNMTDKPRVLWLAHESILINQGFGEFSFTWDVLKRKDINIIKERNYEELEENSIMFMTFQKLYNYKKNNIEIEADLIVVDECHKTIAPTFSDGIDYAEHDGTIRIGLTATPGRTFEDNHENFRLSKAYKREKIDFDIEMIKKFSMQEFESTQIIDYFIEREVLAKVNFEKINYNYNSEEIDFSMSEQQINQALTKLQSRNIMIIEQCVEEANLGKKIMLFASSVDQANALRLMLELNGVPTSIVYGGISKKTIDNQINAFYKFESKVLIVVDKLTTGFDDPKIDCIFIARNTKSLVLYSQMVGRGLRGLKMGGTKSCTIYSDNGLFDDLNRVFNYYDENYEE